MRQGVGDSVDRQVLYEEVWSEPVSVVAPRYGLSDVGLAKICRSLSIPLPSRGYWAKVKAGKVMKRVPLPPSPISKPVSTGLVKVPAEEVAARKRARQALLEASEAAQRIEEVGVTSNDPVPHPLVSETAKRLRQRNGWPQGSGLRTAPTEVLNLKVTSSTLDRALLVADRLLKALEPHGVRASVDGQKAKTWLEFSSPVTALPISLEEDEKVSRHVPTRKEQAQLNRYYDRWRNPVGEQVEYPVMPEHDYNATGVLILRVGHWSGRSWKDTPRTALEDRIREVVHGVLKIGLEQHLREFEDAYREDAYRGALARYKFLSERRTRETERFKRLEADAGAWERAMRLRDYANAVERKAMAEGALTPDVMDWLNWARAKADWLDPNIKVCDAILDAPEPKHPNRYY